MLKTHKIAIDNIENLGKKRKYHLKNINPTKNLDIIIDDNQIENVNLRLYTIKNCLSSFKLLRIQKLLGDAFHDLSNADNSIDPYSNDKIWIEKDGKKIACMDNYLIFSYYVTNKLKCVTIYSLYELYKTDNFFCLFTQKSFTALDIMRIEKIIRIYIKYGFLPPIEEKNLPTIELLSRLVNELHKVNIYVESAWILGIKSRRILYQMIKTFISYLTNADGVIGNKIFMLTFATKNDNADILLRRIINFWKDIISNPSTSYFYVLFVKILCDFVPEIKSRYNDRFN